MQTTNTQNVLNIRDFSHLAQVIQDAEKQGEHVVYLGGNSVLVRGYNAVEKKANELSGQSARQTASLDQFAKSLRESELKANGIPLLDRDTRIRNLVGKTIEAKVASGFLAQTKGDRASSPPKINFDGTGRIKGFSEDATLSELELATLESAIIRDLRETNASGARTAARTESECVMEALGALRKAQQQDLTQPQAQEQASTLTSLEASLKDLWLSGRMTQTTAHAALNDIAKKLHPLNPQLAEQMLNLASEVAKAKALSQRHDNTFGRIFETSLVKHLAENPSVQMLESANVINKFMLKHALIPRANSTPESAIEDLAGALKKDARPWHAEVPEIQNFLNEPNPETLRALLERPVTNGYQMMATYWMAAKVSTEIAGPWMAAADENYSELIKPSRSSDATALSATGIAHVATATALGSKILDRLRIELLRPGSETTLGMNDSEVRALYVDLELLDGDLHAASGSSKSYSAASYGQTLPANRDDILAALKKGQKLLFDKFPQTAQQLQDLYEQVLSSETLEIGSKSGESALSSEGAQSPSSNRYGTGLLHQPKPDGTEAWLAQAHIPSRSGVNVNLPTTFEQSTLERNQNTVNGVSGTTNMLTFMLLYMKDNGAFVTSDHEPVDLGDALMGNLTFLVMDGGHSIPEAMATSTSILANTAYIAPIDTTDGLTRAEQNAREKIRGLALEKIRQERQQVLNTYVTDYSALHEQLASPSSRDRVRQAVAEAFEKTRMTFDALHAERSSVMPAAI